MRSFQWLLNGRMPGLVLVALGVAACAAEADDPTPTRRGVASTLGMDGGAYDDGAVPAYPAYDDGDAEAPTTAYGTDASTAGTGAGTGTGTGAGAGTGTGTGTSRLPAPGGDSCAPSTACPTPMLDLGAVVGDKGSSAQHASGTGSAWLSLRLSERDWSAFRAVPLTLHVTLTSPAGSNFDLFLYPAASGKKSDRECATVGSASQNLTSEDEAVLSFPDHRARDDSRNVTIEVRHVSGPCSDDTPWLLLVEGNAQ